MSASYPTSSKSFSPKVDGVSLVQAADINDVQDEVKAVEDQLIASKLASLAAAPSANKVLTSDGSGNPTWAAKAPDSDLLDSHDTSYFATASHNHSGVYPGIDGWIPVSSTWTYASATTITVPSGAAAIYKVGQGVKLNNTNLKYFYIVGVADTVLTITGGSDYTLDSDAISAISYTNTPDTAIGFPDVFSYTITPTYAGGTTDPTGWTALTGKFSISGRKTILWITGQINRGTGNRSYVKFNLPVVYSVATAANCTHTLLSSTFVVGVVYMSADGVLLSLGAAMANNGYVWLTTTYPI